MKRVLIAVLCVSSVGGAQAVDPMFFNSFELSTRPVRGAVVITEIMSDPTAVPDAAGEWFELSNVAAPALALEGCVVSNGTTQNLLPAITLARNERVVLARNLDPFANGGLSAGATFTFPLTASGSIRLSCGATLIDETTWTSNESAGRSRGVDDNLEDAIANDDPANWCFATALYNASDKGSPGFLNESCGAGAIAGADGLSITGLMVDPVVLSDAKAERVELRNISSGKPGHPSDSSP